MNYFSINDFQYIDVSCLFQFWFRQRQRCDDINECNAQNGGCVSNSLCLNTPGSFNCGECIPGYVGNQRQGCSNRPGICPDGTVCDENAECLKPQGLTYYICKCKVGWAGDGKACGPDRDLDNWPDRDVSCSNAPDRAAQRDKRCKMDNCPDTPNSGQEDADGDGTGDACDDDADNDGIPNTPDNCPLVANPDQVITYIVCQSMYTYNKMYQSINPFTKEMNYKITFAVRYRD